MESEPQQTDQITERKKRRDELEVFWQEHTPKSYAGLLTGDGWKFDRIAQTYTSDSGTVLRQPELHRLACTFIGSVKEQIRADAHNVQHPGNPGNIIAPAAWAAQLRETLDDEFFLLLLLACGGFDEASADLWPVLQGDSATATTVGTGLADVDDRLGNLVGDIRADVDAPVPPVGLPVISPPVPPHPTAGETAPQEPEAPYNVTPGQIVNRAGQYADQGFTVYEKARQATVRKAFADATDDDGRALNVWCCNLLDPFADHCLPGPFTPGCPELTAAGYVPVEADLAASFGLVPIPPPGMRTCMANCKCSLDYILVPAGTTPEQLAEAMEQ